VRFCLRAELDGATICLDCIDMRQPQDF
jgi:hypothetical protein